MTACLSSWRHCARHGLNRRPNDPLPPSANHFEQTTRPLMRTWDHDWEQPETQLALDEAVLLEADRSEHQESIRVWQFARPVVVLGRSSKIAVEVDQEYCQHQRIPVVRRCSGGATIVAGPGCLMYSVVLGLRLRPELQKVDRAHQFVMARIAEALRQQVPAVKLQGICDLTWNDRKFSGNSLRIARRHVLYHGTVLYDADLALVARCLKVAPRQPEYRRERDHEAFLTNVPVDPRRLTDDLHDQFRDFEEHLPSYGSVPLDGAWVAKALGGDLVRRTGELLAERYADPAWHHRH